MTDHDLKIDALRSPADRGAILKAPFEFREFGEYIVSGSGMSDAEQILADVESVWNRTMSVRPGGSRHADKPDLFLRWARFFLLGDPRPSARPPDSVFSEFVSCFRIQESHPAFAPILAEDRRGIWRGAVFSDFTRPYPKSPLTERILLLLIRSLYSLPDEESLLYLPVMERGLLAAIMIFPERRLRPMPVRRVELLEPDDPAGREPFFEQHTAEFVNQLLSSGCYARGPGVGKFPLIFCSSYFHNGFYLAAWPEGATLRTPRNESEAEAIAAAIQAEIATREKSAPRRAIRMEPIDIYEKFTAEHAKLADGFLRSCSHYADQVHATQIYLFDEAISGVVNRDPDVTDGEALLEVAHSYLDHVAAILWRKSGSALTPYRVRVEKWNKFTGYSLVSLDCGVEDPLAAFASLDRPAVRMVELPDTGPILLPIPAKNFRALPSILRFGPTPCPRSSFRFPIVRSGELLEFLLPHDEHEHWPNMSAIARILTRGLKTLDTARRRVKEQRRIGEAMGEAAAWIAAWEHAKARFSHFCTNRALQVKRISGNLAAQLDERGDKDLALRLRNVTENADQLLRVIRVVLQGEKAELGRTRASKLIEDTLRELPFVMPWDHGMPSIAVRYKIDAGRYHENLDHVAERLVSLRTDGDGTITTVLPVVRYCIEELVVNAIKHGSKSEPVDVNIVVGSDSVEVTVANASKKSLPSGSEIFRDPRRNRELLDPENRGRGGLGLLLLGDFVFNVLRGDIQVMKEKSPTIVKMRFPRRLPRSGGTS